jgi:pSer/pThr/pTyr-binding forkhead associated (FHA) protein
MRVILEVVDGVAAGKAVVLESNQKCRVGRGEAADLVIANDGLLSRIHFVIECDQASCRVRDLNSTNGTYLNGARTTEAELGSQDLVMAGSTSFNLRAVPEKDAVAENDAVPPASEAAAAPEPAPVGKNAGMSTLLAMKPFNPPESSKE